METLGKINKCGLIEHEYTGNGFVYKNFDEFEAKSNKPCYAPEYAETVEEAYSYKDLFEITKEFVERNEEVQEYIAENKLSIEHITEVLFESLDWQDPNTEIDQWQNYGSWTE